MEESRLPTLCMTLGMMEIDRYLIWSRDSEEVLLIDPTDDTVWIEKIIRERDLSLKALLLTHGHFDHVLTTSALRDAFQVPLCAAEVEAETLRNLELSSDARWLRQGLSLRADRLSHDGEKFSFLGIEIEALFTPGHTAGSYCYYFPAERLLFSGGTLFGGSLGRVDLPGGNMTSLKRSLNRLLELPADMFALPGHMGQTNTGEKWKSSPIFYY